MKATRIIVAAHALWIIASRPCLPALFDWPAELWAGAPKSSAMRYLWLFPSSVERTLYGVLAVALLLALTGTFARSSCLVAAILLYHFAPLEDVMIGAPGPYARGLTADILILVIVAYAPSDRRWPLILIRSAVASQYVFSTIAKLEVAGPVWFTGDNMRNMASLFDRLGIAPYARLVTDSPVLAWSIGIGWLLITAGMAAAPFSRLAAKIVVPLAAVAHLLAVPLFGIVWLGAPLLLVFVDWPQRSETPNSSAQRASA